MLSYLDAYDVLDFTYSPDQDQSFILITFMRQVPRGNALAYKTMDLKTLSPLLCEYFNFHSEDGCASDLKLSIHAVGLSGREIQKNESQSNFPKNYLTPSEVES